MIGAWWEGSRRRSCLKAASQGDELDQQLFADGLRHEQVLLTKLEKEGRGAGCPANKPKPTTPPVKRWLKGWSSSTGLALQ